MDYKIIITFVVSLPIGAIIGYFFRVWFEDKIIRKRDRENRYAIAFNAFAKEFSSALNRLDNPEERADDIIREEFPRHRDAFLGFVHFMSGSKNETRFKEKWHEYDNKQQRIYKYVWGDSPASDFPELLESDGHIAKDFNQRLKSLIEDLLNIARP